MISDRPFFDKLRFKPATPYEKFVDCLFFLCLMLTPFTHAFIERDTGKGAFVKYFYLLFFVLAMPLWKRYFRRWHWAIGGYFLLLFVGVVSDIFSWGLRTELQMYINVRQLTIGIIFALVSYNLILKDAKYLRILTGILVFNSIASAIMMFVGFNVAEGIERDAEGTRYAVAGQNSNATGFAMVLFIQFLFLVFGNAIKVKPFIRIIVYAMAPLAFFTLFRVSSRGAFVVLILTFPLMMSVVKSISKKFLFMLMGACAVAALIVALLGSEMLRSRLENTIYERDTGGREYIWGLALELWSENPVIGAGLCRHPFEISKKAGMIYSWHMPNRAAHNTYIRALAATGTVGFLLYMMSLTMVFAAAYRNRHLQYGNFFFVAFVAVLLAGMTGNVENHARTFIIWALVLGLDYHVRMARKYGISVLS